MERLTRYFSDCAHGAEGVSDKGLTGAYCRGKFEATAIVDRLAAIEDILGDAYDLDQLRELVEADRDGRCEIHAAKDGDTVYSIFAYVNGLHIRKSNGEPITKITSYVVNDFTRNTVDREFMKTVFPTSEAAEQALKEREEDG